MSRKIPLVTLEDLPDFYKLDRPDLVFKDLADRGFYPDKEVLLMSCPVADLGYLLENGTDRRNDPFDSSLPLDNQEDGIFAASSEELNLRDGGLAELASKEVGIGLFSPVGDCVAVYDASKLTSLQNEVCMGYAFNDPSKKLDALLVVYLN